MRSRSLALVLVMRLMFSMMCAGSLTTRHSLHRHRTIRWRTHQWPYVENLTPLLVSNFSKALCSPCSPACMRSLQSMSRCPWYLRAMWATSRMLQTSISCLASMANSLRRRRSASPLARPAAAATALAVQSFPSSRRFLAISSTAHLRWIKFNRSVSSSRTRSMCVPASSSRSFTTSAGCLATELKLCLALDFMRALSCCTFAFCSCSSELTELGALTCRAKTALLISELRLLTLRPRMTAAPLLGGGGSLAAGGLGGLLELELAVFEEPVRWRFSSSETVQLRVRRLHLRLKISSSRVSSRLLQPDPLSSALAEEGGPAEEARLRSGESLLNTSMLLARMERLPDPSASECRSPE
mmetsp:Transcript_19052/g.53091  ORF Transcript_19052/g.53091 Transcript_19052/m.53091 type:complete len:356 (+) Transcript_19052:637-1704(+)